MAKLPFVVAPKIKTCKVRLGTEETGIIEIEKRDVGRPMAEPSDITDITSTGRKRAAMMYPIFKDMKCEWSGLRFAGGGVEPIIGCSGNIIQPAWYYLPHHLYATHY